MSDSDSSSDTKKKGRKKEAKRVRE
ncbi:unnamed protein product, partial [Onchocerca ochengi]